MRTLEHIEKYIIYLRKKRDSRKENHSVIDIGTDPTEKLTQIH